MREIKDEINWENFLDNFFDLYRPLTEKNEYKNGLTIYYKRNDIYVWCDLSTDRLTIKKLEFGRLTTDEEGREQVNWVKGVFIHNKPLNTTFLQTSFDSEYFDKKNKYTIKFGCLNKNVIAQFLQTPCLTGWTEEEFKLDDINYKIIVSLNQFKWTIKLKDIGEQDLPTWFDLFDIWYRVKIADSSKNNHRRTINKTIVKPMNA